MHLRFKANMLSFGLLLISLGCSTNSDKPIEYQLPSTHLRSDTVTGERIGGGSIYFTIQRSQDKKVLTFNSRVYKDAPDVKVFTVIESELQAKSWQLLQNLFDGTVDIGGIIYATQAPTGTWFKAYVQDSNHTIRVADPDIIQELSSLQSFIEHHA